MPKDTPARREALKQATFEALINKKPAETTVQILLDPGLADELDEARSELLTAEERLKAAKQQETGEEVELAADVDEKRKRVDAVVAACREETVELRFRAMSRVAYDKLVDRHPPTEAQKKDGQTTNVETFGPALIAATLVEPKLTEDEVRKLQETWNMAEASILFNTALGVNVRRRVGDLGKDSSSMRS
jgi:hypothetical protein